jgi:hypothetical protein
MADTTYVDFVGPPVPAAWLNDVNRLTYDLPSTASGKGTALVGSNDAGGYYAGTTAEAQLQELGGWQFGDPIRRYGTTSDLTAALNAALAALPAASLLTVPRGTWNMTTGFTHNGQRFNLLGEGRQVTNIDFRPASTATAITLNYTTDTGGMFEPSIVGFGFTSGGGNTQTKTAISLVNVANAHIRDITIGQGAWAGTDSIFLKTAGRQSLHLHGCDIACDRPIVCAQNATFTTLNDDFFLFEHLELIGTSATRPCMEFLDGVMHTNTTVRNTDFAQGQGGIKWVSTTSAGSSYKFKIENCRFEQSLDATSWCIDLQENTGSRFLQDVTIDGAYFDSVNNGIRLRNAQRVTLRNCTWSATSAKVAIDMTFVTGSRLLLENCLSAGATFTFTNARCVRREETSTSNNLPGLIEEWVFFDASSYAVGAQQSDAFWGGVPVSVANNAIIDIADSNFTGVVAVSTSEDVTAMAFLTGGTGTVNMPAALNPFGFFSTTSANPAPINIFFSAGKYKLENKRGATVTVSVFRIGTSR